MTNNLPEQQHYFCMYELVKSMKITHEKKAIMAPEMEHQKRTCCSGVFLFIETGTRDAGDRNRSQSRYDMERPIEREVPRNYEVGQV
jgi:hypothetical protein